MKRYGAGGDSSPEREVLLWSARIGQAPQEDGDRILEFLAGGLDWPLLRQAAVDHGILPLLYTRLGEVGEHLVPPAERAQIKALYVANARRNLRMTARLLTILKLLREKGIEAIPLKGPSLAEAAYGDVALRQFVDLDILVAEEQILKARDLLVSLGFTPRYTLTKRQESVHMRRDIEYTFRSQKSMFILDVHWRLAPSYYRVDMHNLLERHALGSLAGFPIPSLAPDDLLLYLCFRGMRDMWDKLGLLCDVAALLRRNQDWDWGPLLEKATSSGLRRTFLLGLALAHDILRAELRPEIAEVLHRDRKLLRPRTEMATRFLTGPIGVESPGDWRVGLFPLRMMDSLSDKFRYCMDRLLLPTARDWEVLRLPDYLFPLYYLLRPLRLASKWVRRPAPCDTGAR